MPEVRRCAGGRPCPVAPPGGRHCLAVRPCPEDRHAGGPPIPEAAHARRSAHRRCPESAPPCPEVRHPAGERRRIVALEHHRPALLRRRAAAPAADACWTTLTAALVDESDHQRAALDHVGVPDRLLLDADVVEVRAVRAAEILDDVAPVLHADLRVPARDHAVVGADRALETTTDVDGLGRRQLDRSLAALAVPEQEACH